VAPRKPIVRPRHLFPDAASIFIEMRRGLLRAKWLFTKELDWFPAWTIGAAAGIAGLMLAVMLFFMSDSPQASVAGDQNLDPSALFDALKPTVSTETNAPSPTLPPADAWMIPPGSVGQPTLTSTISRSFLPYDWRQDELSTAVAKPVRSQFPQNRILASDPWRTTLAFRQQAQPFAPYALRGASIPVSPTTVTSTDHINPLLVPANTKSLGLRVEKSQPVTVTAGEPVTYRILITNHSQTPAQDVVVRERISAINRVSDVNPPASQLGDELVWSLGTVQSNAQKTLTVTLVPNGQNPIIETETSLQAITSVSGQAHVAKQIGPRVPAVPNEIVPIWAPVSEQDEVVPAIPQPVIKEQVGEPVLDLAVTPLGVLKRGDTLSLVFTVKNIGTATASDVNLYVELSDEFEHRYGEHVKHHIPRLEPGDSRRALLQATANEMGKARVAASLKLGVVEKKSTNMTVPIEAEPNKVTSRPFGDAPSVIEDDSGGIYPEFAE